MNRCGVEMTKDRAWQCFKYMDDTDDGVIDRMDFCAFMLAPFESTEIRGMQRAIFQVIGDGTFEGRMRAYSHSVVRLDTTVLMDKIRRQQQMIAERESDFKKVNAPKDIDDWLSTAQSGVALRMFTDETVGEGMETIVKLANGLGQRHALWCGDSHYIDVADIVYISW